MSDVVDGGWSSWIHGLCSKTCGGGMRNVTRQCNNLKLSCEGNDCTSESHYTEKCNDICCPGKS